ncbi:MAG: 5/3-nucleotidase [Bacillota bacterium]|nr:5/3-nucleotidase [Bacillota bacterium]
MFVLLSNDDGIDAAGLTALAGAFSPADQVAIVAPDRERSASGHAITMDRPLRVREVKHFAGPAWAVTGTPGDCVKLALTTLLPRKPDLVVAGINRGPNLGTDVFYSGTVAAALEGLLFGLPALAVSLATHAPDADYSLAARLARAIVQRLLAKPALAETLLNVNVPARPAREIRGLSITRLGTRRYKNTFEARQDPRGQTYYWLAGEPLPQECPPDTDIAAVAAGRISITPLSLDLTDYRRLADLKGWTDKPFDI